MKNMIARFEQLKTLYDGRRSYFKQCVEGFTSRSSRTIRARGLELLQEADRLALELKADMVVVGENNEPTPVIIQKFKAFKKAYNQLHAMTKPAWRQWAEAIVIALLLALVLRNFFFGLYHVPTGSAETTILVGDRIWGNKMCYFFTDVKRGDLVIFDNPLFQYEPRGSFKYWWQRYVGFPISILDLPVGPDNWVKRVIAVPGDTIEGRVENGKTVIYRNGKKLDEPYVNTLPLISLHKTSGFIPLSNIGPLVVPDFLSYKEKVLKYSYDPSKPLNQQPYYCMTEDDVQRRYDGQPELAYAFEPEISYNVNRDEFGPFKVPDGKYWVMGDSRRNSQDSRWWLFLDQELVSGRASFVIYSIDSEEVFWIFDLIKHPIDFWCKHVRWNRFFKGLNGYVFSQEPQA